jgi:hypothetical protein
MIWKHEDRDTLFTTRAKHGAHSMTGALFDHPITLSLWIAGAYCGGGFPSRFIIWQPDMPSDHRHCTDPGWPGVVE